MPTGEPEPIVGICFNPGNLVRLTKAMALGTTNVKLMFKDAAHAIRVEVLKNEEFPSCKGIITSVMES